jgi:hypothetical protein
MPNLILLLTLDNLIVMFSMFRKPTTVGLEYAGLGNQKPNASHDRFYMHAASILATFGASPASRKGGLSNTAVVEHPEVAAMTSHLSKEDAEVADYLSAVLPFPFTSGGCFVLMCSSHHEM